MPNESQKARNFLNKTHATEFARSRTPVCIMNKRNSMRVEKWRPCTRQGTLKIRRYFIRRPETVMSAKFHVISVKIHAITSDFTLIQ